MTKNVEKCACSKCANPGCTCGTSSGAKACCCGSACKCGAACECGTGCGCAAAKR